MDLHRLRAGEWIAAVSGAVLLVSLWLPWQAGEKVHDVDGSAYLQGSGQSAWALFSALDVLLAAIGVAALLLFVLTSRSSSTGPGLLLAALIVPFNLVGVVMVVIRFLGIEGDPGLGAWMGLVSTFGVLVGSLVAMRDERLSPPDRTTDQTGVPAPPVVVETLPGPPPA